MKYDRLFNIPQKRTRNKGIKKHLLWPTINRNNMCFYQRTCKMSYAWPFIPCDYFVHGRYTSQSVAFKWSVWHTVVKPHNHCTYLCKQEFLVVIIIINDTIEWELTSEDFGPTHARRRAMGNDLTSSHSRTVTTLPSVCTSPGFRFWTYTLGIVRRVCTANDKWRVLSRAGWRVVQKLTRKYRK